MAAISPGGGSWPSINTCTTSRFTLCKWDKTCPTVHNPRSFTANGSRSTVTATESPSVVQRIIGTTTAVA
jgi:hypothetical protein